LSFKKVIREDSKEEKKRCEIKTRMSFWGEGEENKKGEGKRRTTQSVGDIRTSRGRRVKGQKKKTF